MHFAFARWDEVSCEVWMAFIQVLVFCTAQLLLLQAYCIKGKTVSLISVPRENIVGFTINYFTVMNCINAGCA